MGDPRMEAKAEEKLKTINDAYDRIEKALFLQQEAQRPQPSTNNPSRAGDGVASATGFARPPDPNRSVTVDIPTAFGAKELLIGPAEIRYGKQTLALGTITGIRYGSVVTKLQGALPICYSHKLEITDGKAVLRVGADDFTRDGRGGQRFRDAIDALWDPVTARIILRFLRTLASGTATVFHDAGGDLRLDTKSLLWNRSGLFGIRGPEKAMAWTDYHGSTLDQGRINLFRKAERRPWASLSLQHTWNAVCLGPLISEAYRTSILPRP